jgi:hypothetical protein
LRVSWADLRLRLSRPEQTCFCLALSCLGMRLVETPKRMSLLGVSSAQLLAQFSGGPAVAFSNLNSCAAFFREIRTIRIASTQPLFRWVNAITPHLAAASEHHCCSRCPTHGCLHRCRLHEAGSNSRSTVMDTNTICYRSQLVFHICELFVNWSWVMLA